MRQIILDTETTGLRHEDGHRVIEIGCVELLDRNLSGESLHFYIHPERAIDQGAMDVHGITLEDLADKPKFAEVAQRIASFCEGAEVLIHNAPFDMGFLDAEFARIAQYPRRFKGIVGKVTDTLALAKSLHPGKRNSLDSLCDRYGVNNAHRTRHGALLDAELLAEVYLAMTRGQESLVIDQAPQVQRNAAGELQAWPPADLLLTLATADELLEHERVLQVLDKASKGATVWRTQAEPS
jgi:DNA polymerase III subunit epsilon